MLVGGSSVYTSTVSCVLLTNKLQSLLEMCEAFASVNRDSKMMFSGNLIFDVDEKCCDYFDAVLQYFLSPLLLSHGFVAILMSNALFVIAFSYYHYLNFLGYDGTFLTLFLT
jgi:hypothetical protein